MYSEEDLDSAVTANILTPESATAFRRHAEQRRSTPAVDEEYFRLITGFNDIFVVIACILLLASVAWIGASVTRWLGAVAVSVVSWGLAEYFTRQRRMALPSIVLLLAFISGILANGFILQEISKANLILACAVAAGAAWLHWLRFQVPITVAAGAATVIGLFASLLLSAVPETLKWTTAISLVSGIAVFALAMRWDMADPKRQTRKSDVAFWLHLLAAPLLVHPAFTALGVSDGQTSLAQAIAVILLYALIGLVSLVIDRRALMLSALAYVLYTFSALLKLYGVVSLSAAITALVIGSALLLLSAFWHRSRKFALGLLPLAVQKRLPLVR